MSPRILCDGRAVLHVGDCLEILRGIPPSSVDSVVTDPPYGLSDHKPADVVACLTAWLAGEEYRPKKKGFMGRAWDSWVPGPEAHHGRRGPPDRRPPFRPRHRPSQRRRGHGTNRTAHNPEMTL